MRSRYARWMTLAVMVMIAGGAVISSCAKHEKIVDPSYTTPEGQVSGDVRLVTWREMPNQVALFEKGGTTVDDPRDVYLADKTYDLAEYAKGTVNGMVLDGTLASGYQMFRREPNGGLSLMFDYTMRPAVKWLDGHWALYMFTDPSPTADLSYVARGVDAAGGYTPTSPLSTPGAPIDTLYNVTIRFLNDTQDMNDQNNKPFGNDSTVTWDPVPGAARYLVQIYTLRSMNGKDLVLAGRATPICTKNSITKLLAITDHPVTFGIHQPFPGPTLTNSPTYHQDGYYVRVSALGPNNELIGTSYSQCESFATSTEVTLTNDADLYAKFSMGAVRLPHMPYTGEVDKRSCSRTNEAFLPTYRDGFTVEPGSPLFTWNRTWRPSP